MICGEKNLLYKNWIKFLPGIYIAMGNPKPLHRP